MDQAGLMQVTMSEDYGEAGNTSLGLTEKKSIEEDLGMYFLRTCEDIRLLQEATSALGRSCPLMSE